MAKVSYTVRSTGSNFISTIITAILAIFMLIIPFYRGLFFRINYIPAVAVISIIFTVFLIYRLKDRKYKVLDTYMDITVLLIPFAYLISFFFAVNAKDAFDMLLLYSSYFMMYKLTSSLSSENEKIKDTFINVIIASTVILSFTSMLYLAGVPGINGVLKEKRLYGLYQYPNSTASVLAVGIILSLNKLLKAESTKVTALYQMILTALISNFILTLSRGGYLVLAAVLLLNFILVKTREKVKMLLAMFTAFLSSSLLIYKFYNVPEEVLSTVWIYYFAGILASALIIYAIYFVRNRARFEFSDKAINISLISIVVIFVGTAAFLITAKEPIEYRVEHQASQESSWNGVSIGTYELDPGFDYVLEFDVKTSVESPYSYGVVVNSYNGKNQITEILNQFESAGIEYARKSLKFTTRQDTEKVEIILYNYEAGSYTSYNNIAIKDTKGIIVEKLETAKYIPSYIVNRISDISFATQNVSQRVSFTRDGIKIIKDYPIAGAGGGAWKNLYRQYQSIPYSTTEVHNFYVQYGTEVGIIGLAPLIGVLILFVVSMVKSIRNGSKYIYLYLAAMLQLLHSSIDFNLSLPAVAFILWILLGLINSDKNAPLIEKLPQKYTSALILAAALIISLSSSSVYYGMRLGVKGADTAKENRDISRAIELYEKASTFDRYSAVYRNDLAQIMNNQLRKTKDSRYLEGFNKQIELLRKYEPYNHEYTPKIVNMLLAIGEYERASALAEVKLQNEPLVAQSYMLKIGVYYEIANYFVKKGKAQDAVPYLEKVVETNNELKEINAKLEKPLVLEGDYLKRLEAAARTLEMIKADRKK